MINQIPKNIKAIRESKGMTKAEFARAIGRQPQNVDAIEKEGANLTLKTLAKVAKALKCDVEDFFNG